MKNVFGNAITLTLFGESHGKQIGAVIDGLAPGIEINEDYIREKLSLRRPQGKISTARVEADEFDIVSGVFNGKTTGTPLTILIPNANTNSGDYANLMDSPRPSHADYTAQCKYHGFQDYRGGGHFSGRITAAIVCACAIIQYALIKKGIEVGSHICYLQGIEDQPIKTLQDVEKLNGSYFPVLNEKSAEKMKELISQAASEGDSVGGVLETYVFGVPAGIGEPWFDSVESLISHAMFSIPGVKGIEFGLGFAFADVNGSFANDEFCIKDGKVVTKTNNNGGINGGITNGMTINFRTVVKPTPSIFKEQNTVRLSDMTEQKIQINGRHDPAIVHRARAVVDALTSFVVADMLTVKYGTDYLAK